MTFLELCQRLNREIYGAGETSEPTAVAGQVGKLAELVDWIQSAWTDIQLLHHNWRWMRRECKVSTAASDGSYAYTDFTDVKTAAAIVADTFSHWWLDPDDCRFLWSMYLSASGQSNEGDLIAIDFDNWRYLFDRGTGASQEGRPLYVTQAPDNTVKLGPKPDAIYVVRGWYQQAATELSGDDDVPDMPAQFHLAIVWRAMMYYGEDRSAPEKWAQGNNHYGQILARLEQNQLPKPMLAGPLA